MKEAALHKLQYITFSLILLAATIKMFFERTLLDVASVLLLLLALLTWVLMLRIGTAWPTLASISAYCASLAIQYGKNKWLVLIFVLSSLIVGIFAIVEGLRVVKLNRRGRWPAHRP
jgi:hypothetical protein